MPMDPPETRIKVFTKRRKRDEYKLGFDFSLRCILKYIILNCIFNCDLPLISAFYFLYVATKEKSFLWTINKSYPSHKV